MKTNTPPRLRLERLEDRATPAMFTVTTVADGGVGSLRNVIELANATPGADTVVFDPAVQGKTVTLTTFIDPLVGNFTGPTGLYVSDGLTIEGTGETITRGGTDPFRLFAVAPSKIVTFRNLTLSNGFALGGYAGAGGGGGAGLGGAIYNQGVVILTDSTLSGNRATGGAGGSTRVDAGQGGGGLSSRRPATAVDGQGPNGGVASGSTPGFGGGGAGGHIGLGTQPQNGNYGGGGGGGFGGFGGGDGGFGAGGGGGGAGGGSGGFAGFGAGQGGGNGGPGGGGAGLGGAIFNQGGAVIVANSTLAGNSAQGGISEGALGSAAAGQTGGGFGGAIFNHNGTITLTSVTIANNSVADGIGSGLANPSDGGAVYNLFRSTPGVTPNLGASATFANSVFAGSVGGSDVVNARTGTGAATVTAAGPNLASTPVVNATGGTVTGVPFLVGDAKLGPLQDNGGRSPTLAPLPGSPAIDAGDNARVTAADLDGGPPFFDQRGQGFVRVSNGKTDLGAVEVQVPVVLAPATLPPGRVGVAYAQLLTATGPVGPFTFLETFGPLAPPTPSSALPPGLTLAADGRVSGTPTAEGTYTFTVRAANATAEIGTATYSVFVGPRARVPVLVGGPTDGSARLLSSAAGPLALGDPLALLPGLGAVARVAVGDVNGDGVPDRVTGAGPGAVSRVVVFDGMTGVALVAFQVFESGFTGGVYVAAADLDGDGKAEVVVTPDEGGGPVVAVYRGAALAAGTGGEAAQATRFFGIEDPAFRGGARPGLGDLTGDGKADLVVSAGFLGGPRVALFDGTTLAGGTPPVKLRPDFFAFEDTLRNGAFVAAGDATGDGFADLAFGGGPGGAPRVRVFDGAALLAAGPFSRLDDVPAAQRANFFAGDSGLRGGVRLAMADTDGDGRADLVTGSGAGEASRVRVYTAVRLLSGSPADQELDPFGGAVLPGGVFVG